MLEELQNLYAGRGINLMRVAGKWAFRTAPDLSFLIERNSIEPRKLSKAALETLLISTDRDKCVTQLLNILKRTHNTNDATHKLK